MPKVSGLLTTAGLKTKTGEVESKIPDVSGLVKKQIIMLNYQTLRENTLLLVIVINL